MKLRCVCWELLCSRLEGAWCCWVSGRKVAWSTTAARTNQQLQPFSWKQPDRPGRIKAKLCHQNCELLGQGEWEGPAEHTGGRDTDSAQSAERVWSALSSSSGASPSSAHLLECFISCQSLLCSSWKVIEGAATTLAPGNAKGGRPTMDGELKNLRG